MRTETGKPLPYFIWLSAGLASAHHLLRQNAAPRHAPWQPLKLTKDDCSTRFKVLVIHARSPVTKAVQYIESSRLLPWSPELSWRVSIWSASTSCWHFRHTHTHRLAVAYSGTLMRAHSNLQYRGKSQFKSEGQDTRWPLSLQFKVLTTLFTVLIFAVMRTDTGYKWVSFPLIEIHSQLH